MLSLQKLEAALPGVNGGRLSMCKACTASLCNTTIAKTGTTAWFFVLFLDESNSYLLWWVKFVLFFDESNLEMEKEKWKSNFIEYSTRKRLTIVSSSCRGTDGKLIREEGFCHSHQTHQAWEDNPCFTLWKDNTKRDLINPTKHSKIDKPCFTSFCFPTLTWTIVHTMYKLTHKQLISSGTTATEYEYSCGEGVRVNSVYCLHIGLGLYHVNVNVNVWQMCDNYPITTPLTPVVAMRYQMITR